MESRTVPVRELSNIICNKSYLPIKQKGLDRGKFPDTSPSLLATTKDGYHDIISGEMKQK